MVHKSGAAAFGAIRVRALCSASLAILKNLYRIFNHLDFFVVGQIVVDCLVKAIVPIRIIATISFLIVPCSPSPTRVVRRASEP